MSTFKYAMNCPHCKVQKASFSGDHILPGANDSDYRIPLTCSHCSEVVVISAFTAEDEIGKRFYNNDWKINLNSSECVFHIYDHYPKGNTHEAPANVPDRIGNIFIEAQENFARGKYDTCILLCGKVLDLATKEMDSAWKLERRLKTLADEGKITSDMANWAEEIRLDRNDAAHADEEFDEADASEIVGFTEAFLNYVYTLPAMVRERRKQRLIG